MTADDAATLIGCKPGLVYKLCAARKLRHRRIGFGRGLIVITEDAVKEYLASREVDPVPEGAEDVPERPRRKAPAVKDYHAEWKRQQRERKGARR